MTARRVPGTRAGLKERSQSAYAAPMPKPVESAMGHVRPVQCIGVIYRKYRKIGSEFSLL